MARIENTVFISYRRTDVYIALAIYEKLKNQGYDVFFDYRSIPSGDFKQIITSNIQARAHFLLILTPTALDRCDEPGDWLRREIEIAIVEKRNIVPLFFKGFGFGASSVKKKLTGKLKNLSGYNGLHVYEDFFDEAIDRLRTQYLNILLETVLHPVSEEVQKVVREEQVAADKALEQIEDDKDLVKQAEVKRNAPIGQSDLKPVEIPKEERKEEKKIEKPPVTSPREISSSSGRGQDERILRHYIPEEKKVVLNPKLRLFGIIAGGLVLAIFCMWGTVNYLSNILFNRLVTATPTPTDQFIATLTSELATATTSSPTQTSLSTVPTLGIGSNMISDKDGMTLLYVPAGEFTMGSDADDALAECQKFRSDCQRDWFTDEEPPHTVNIDAFWIDQTEVTVRMYSLCVQAAVCKEPNSKTSNTNSSYYDNADFDNYPVIYVDWNMAKTYCEWMNRRLPNEAEWEKAARGKNAFIYPWGNDAPNDNLLNYGSNVGDTTEVGKYPDGASPYGALDMAGNVWEWVADWYDVYPGGDSSTSSDFGQKYRVLRGGSGLDLVNLVRSADRFRDDPEYPLFSIGFRCAMSATS